MRLLIKYIWTLVLLLSMLSIGVLVADREILYNSIILVEVRIENAMLETEQGTMLCSDIMTRIEKEILGYEFGTESVPCIEKEILGLIKGCSGGKCVNTFVGTKWYEGTETIPPGKYHFLQIEIGDADGAGVVLDQAQSRYIIRQPEQIYNNAYYRGAKKVHYFLLACIGGIEKILSLQ